MFYAKSDPKPVPEAIKEHTNKLIKNLEILEKTYGEEILSNKEFDKERFWELLNIICSYHDIGKVYTPFQNIILEKLRQEKIPTKFNYDYIKHEQLSPMFVPTEKFQLAKDEKKLVYQSIFYHHERKNLSLSSEIVNQIIQEDIVPNIDKIKDEIGLEIKENLNSMYLSKVENAKRITQNDKLYLEYILLKGLLHRLDHSSSAGIDVENSTKDNICEFTQSFMNNKFKPNELQTFSRDNQDKNILVIGSTGMGKTEAALLWSGNSKMFFTLPIRISINAIYERIKKEIGYKHVGLLHSTAMNFLEKDNEFENSYLIYDQTKNLYEKVTTCTIDQIFTFVFKYKGYEKIYSTLSYSKVIIDEIQGYSPEIVAVILKGLQMINQIGGKFMVITATLPRIYKEELKKMGIEFEDKEFIKDTKRHRIKLENKEILEDIDNMYEKSKNGKVLIIVNTVNKSIELYKNLKEKGINNINLLHSRFIQNDRNEKETEIKEFSKDRNKNGIWITTQLVEASLDIDFDYLYTEMSTLDSLFQRLGRCYRSREYDSEEPNVYIYNKNASGVYNKNSVYDKDIHNKSVEMLEKFNNQILEEKDKVKLVDKLYSEEELKDTQFFKKFKSGMEVLNNIIDYDTSKTDAQKLLRNIDNITVIPKLVYDENNELFEKYKKCKDKIERSEIRRKINRLTTSISMSQEWKIKQYFIYNKYLEEIPILDMKYDKEIGLLLEKDEEYELNKRFCD